MGMRSQTIKRWRELKCAQELNDDKCKHKRKKKGNACTASAGSHRNKQKKNTSHGKNWFHIQWLLRMWKSYSTCITARSREAACRTSLFIWLCNLKEKGLVDLALAHKKKLKKKTTQKKTRQQENNNKKRNTNIRGGQVWSLRIIITQPSLFILIISMFSVLNVPSIKRKLQFSSVLSACNVSSSPITSISADWKIFFFWVFPSDASF